MLLPPLATRGSVASQLLSVSKRGRNKQLFSKMAATTDDSNAPQSIKKKYLGIPEAVFLVRKPGYFSLKAPTHNGV